MCTEKYLVDGRKYFNTAPDPDGFGLWIDEQLLKGRSQPVATFQSGSLTAENDFHIDNLELWTFR